MDNFRTSSVGDGFFDSDEPDAAELTAALTPKQRIALDSLALGVSVPEAAKDADVHRTTVNRWLLRDAEFIAALNAVQAEIVAATHMQMLSLGNKAVAAVSHALDKGNGHLGMQVLKSPIFTGNQIGSASSKLVARQMKLAQKRQSVQFEQEEAQILQQYAAVRGCKETERRYANAACDAGILRGSAQTAREDKPGKLQTRRPSRGVAGRGAQASSRCLTRLSESA